MSATFPSSGRGCHDLEVMTQGFQAVLWSRSPVHGQEPEPPDSSCSCLEFGAAHQECCHCRNLSGSQAGFHGQLVLFLTWLQGESWSECCSCQGTPLLGAEVTSLTLPAGGNQVCFELHALKRMLPLNTFCCSSCTKGAEGSAQVGDPHLPDLIPDWFSSPGSC